jgi:micrococcal nuclease
MRKLLIFLLVLPFFCCDLVASPDFKEYTGKVTRIIDGDTFEVLLEGNRTEKIRLNAIDCPERGQDFYAVARKGLSELIFQKRVKIRLLYYDRYQRAIADVYLPDGQYVNALMIQYGWAWHYKQYSNDTHLAELENKARTNKIGLWEHPNATPPWEFRKKKK